MSFNDICWKLQSWTESLSTRFLATFLLVAPGSLILFVAGVHDVSLAGQPALSWSVLTISLFVALSATLGLWKFWRPSTPPSILVPMRLFTSRIK
ncbi:MAG: hypothetical protein ACKV2V_29795 [Blastocatellia bacterium]